MYGESNTKVICVVDLKPSVPLSYFLSPSPFSPFYSTSTSSSQLCWYSSWCESHANWDLLLRGFTWGKYWLTWKQQATRNVVYFVSWDAYLTCIYLAGVKLRFVQFL